MTGKNASLKHANIASRIASASSFESEVTLILIRFVAYVTSVLIVPFNSSSGSSPISSLMR